MKYLSITTATDWPRKRPWQVKLIRAVLFFVPRASPDYETKMHLVKKWLIEFIDTEGALLPCREIALDQEDQLVFAGPDERNYGFWLDTNLKYEDFNGESIKKEEFEHYWKMSGRKPLARTFLLTKRT